MKLWMMSCDCVERAGRLGDMELLSNLGADEIREWMSTELVDQIMPDSQDDPTVTEENEETWYTGTDSGKDESASEEDKSGTSGSSGSKNTVASDEYDDQSFEKEPAITEPVPPDEIDGTEADETQAPPEKESEMPVSSNTEKEVSQNETDGAEANEIKDSSEGESEVPASSGDTQQDNVPGENEEESNKEGSGK